MVWAIKSIVTDIYKVLVPFYCLQDILVLQKFECSSPQTGAIRTGEGGQRPFCFCRC